MSFLISASLSYSTPEPSPTEGVNASFNLPAEVNQLLNNFFDLAWTMLSAERLELWFAKAFPIPPIGSAEKGTGSLTPPENSIHSDIGASRPHLWRTRNVSKARSMPTDPSRMVRLEMPVRCGQVTYGLVVAYFLPDSSNIADVGGRMNEFGNPQWSDATSHARELLRLSVSNLELSLNLALRLRAEDEAEVVVQGEATASAEASLMLNNNNDELMPTLQLEFSRATRHNLSLAFMLIRVDTELLENFIARATGSSLLQLEGLKGTFGGNGSLQVSHIMRHLAYLARRYLRVSDAVYNFDNSNLAVILPHTNELQAYRAADKLLTLLDSQSVFGHLGLESGQWLAIGISSFPYLSSNPETLIKHCQQALARVKRTAPLKKENEPGAIQPATKSPQAPIHVWKATRMLSINEINIIGDEQAVRAVMRGFQFTDLTPFIEQAADPKKKAKLRVAFDVIPADLSRQYQVAGLSLKKLAGSEALTVAMSDPNNTALVATLARATGANIIAVVTRSEQLKQFIEDMLE